MISRIITRGLSTAARLCLPSTTALAGPKYHFGRVNKASESTTSFKKTIEDQIKAEEKELVDLKEDQINFQKTGWTVSKDNALVELFKKIGNYEVRLLSQIKSPSAPQESEEKAPNQEGQQDVDDNEMNEVTILVNRFGSQKTMVISALVSQGFEISSINFAETPAKAKQSRFDIFGSNQYTGPDVDTLSDELFTSINSFLQDELGVQGQLLHDFVSYCVSCEQTFYIEWLKNVRDMF